MLSNGSRLPEKVGLDGYFECVVFAQDHRVAKPDKAIFEIVERQLDVPAARCVLVGDHPVNDVSGAKRAGWRAVWIDRDRTGGGGGRPGGLGDEVVQADAVVESLHDLPAALATLEALGDAP